MDQKFRIDVLTEKLERQFGVVLNGKQIGEAVGIKSRTTLRRWLAMARTDGLKAFEFRGRQGARVLASELASWLIKQEDGRGQAK